MLMRNLLLTTLAFSMVLVGCKNNSQPQKTEPQAGGLKALIKEDIVVGKPTRFNPKMKPVANGDAVWVVYTGTFKDGREFDSNDPKTKPDARPLSFQMGTGSMIKGWEEGLLGMYPGGVRKLSVPAAMGYGDRPKEGIPLNSDLYFTVKLLDVVKAGDDLVYGVYDEKIGSGPVAKDKSKCTVHYTVKEVDGRVIEDTRDAKSIGKPVTFTIGKEDVLASIDDGVKGMRVGGIRELSLPPQIGFNPNERSGVAPNMVFYVRIELLKVE